MRIKFLSHFFLLSLVLPTAQASEESQKLYRCIEATSKENEIDFQRVPHLAVHRVAQVADASKPPAFMIRDERSQVFSVVTPAGSCPLDITKHENLPKPKKRITLVAEITCGKFKGLVKYEYIPGRDQAGVNTGRAWFNDKVTEGKGKDVSVALDMFPGVSESLKTTLNREFQDHGENVVADRAAIDDWKRMGSGNEGQVEIYRLLRDFSNQKALDMADHCRDYIDPGLYDKISPTLNRAVGVKTGVGIKPNGANK